MAEPGTPVSPSPDPARPAGASTQPQTDQVQNQGQPPVMGIGSPRVRRFETMRAVASIVASRSPILGAPMLSTPRAPDRLRPWVSPSELKASGMSRQQRRQHQRMLDRAARRQQRSRTS